VWYNAHQYEPVGYRVVVLYTLLGLLVGALLNHAADHLPQRRSILSPTHCPSCGTKGGWGDAVALLGLLTSHGRCVQCGARYPPRRPLLELVTALAFGFFWLRYGPSVQLALITLYSCLLFLIFVIDLERRLILQVVIYPAILLAIVGSCFHPGLGLRRAALGGVIAFLFFYLVMVIGKLVFKRTAMGRGDVNLAAFVGLIVGFPEVILALVIAISLGGIVAFVLLLGRVKGLRSYIPYGVFLAVAGVTVLVFGGDILACTRQRDYHERQVALSRQAKCKE
jgi:leader peptidase (prepilin peptidase)/N-methyltransferase